jgi:hypothetical protein
MRRGYDRASAVTQTSRFRDLHRLTHEVELLISGALVFGLSQVPGYIEGAFEFWSLRLEGLAMTAATYLFVYSVLLVYSLLGTFVLHLCLRGYWVALLGLESVWPEGWSSEKLKFGPHGRREADRMFGSLAVSIDKADDRASLLFAAGALLVTVFLYSLIMMLVSIGLGAGVAYLTGGRIPGVVGLFSAFGLFLFVTVALTLVDRHYGHRIPAGTRAGRWFAAALRTAMWLSPARATGPVQFVFQNHLGEKKLGGAIAVAAAVMATVLIGGMLWRSGQFRIDGWRYFDDSPAAEAYFDPRYYRDSPATRDGLLPSIDAEVITGPYLKLYLPYRPRRHNPLLDTKCPQPADDRAQCVGNLYTVSLAGQALTGLTFDFTRDMPSGFVGVATFLDVRTLAPGRHELTIVAPPRREGETLTIRIPFYR